jgi:acetylornithine deacetylase/succinyl-diaminopimelate desuccinylase-like protein
VIRHLLTSAAILAMTTGAANAALPAPINEASIRAAAVASFPDYLHLLTLPNISVGKGEELPANANWLQKQFEQRGFTVQQIANDGKPLVIGSRPSTGARKTVLFYLHYDGQPVVPSQWAQPSPWQPVLKRKGADGKWAAVDMAQLMKPDFDPELRVFARAAADDKGPIMMLLASLDLMKQHGIEPAVNIKVMLDGEEEINSPGIAKAVEHNGALLKADALVILDGAAHPAGRPTAVFGNRGVQSLELTVYGPNTPLHSGHYGNFAPNPAFRLARLLATMKDDHGRVTIPGYYARTRFSKDDKALLANSGYDEAALRKRFGVGSIDKVGNNYAESIQYPSLNIRGMASADIGAKAANIIPKDAIAEIDIRTTSEADAAYLTALVRTHIKKQGYAVVDRDPTVEERERHPKLAKLTEGLAAQAARQSLDAPIRHWVERSLASAYEGDGGALQPILLRAMGGTVPTAEISGPLKLPFVLVPVVNPDNNQHTYDENLRMGHYLTGMRSMLGMLTTPMP